MQDDSLEIIETYWNVNTEDGFLQKIDWNEIIETYWNVNTI